MGREYLRIALRALGANKFRSLLTVSSITLGAFSIVLMTSLAQSGLTTLSRDIEELGGAKIIMLAPKPVERRIGKQNTRSGGMTLKDRHLLYSAVPHLASKTTYAGLGRKDALNDVGKNTRTDLVAADGGFFAVLALRVAEGRLFTEDDNRAHARVCVVAHDLAEHLWEGKAVGRWLTVDGNRCQVIGKLAKIEHWDTNFGFRWLDFVVMPLDTLAETRPQILQDAAIQMRTDGVASNDIVKRVTNAILVDQHHGVDDFQIWDFNAFMAQFYKIFALMEAIVGVIAGIALVVGGIGVMNMMLVSVSERTREIGIRKALGASPRAIASQFLSEAVLLSGLGGLLGTVGGVVAAGLANRLIHHLKSLWIGEISEVAVVVAMLVSLAVGVGFGFFPARRASALEPVAAMRR